MARVWKLNGNRIAVTLVLALTVTLALLSLPAMVPNSVKGSGHITPSLSTSIVGFNCTDWNCNPSDGQSLSVASNGTLEARHSNTACGWNGSYYDSAVRGTPPPAQGGAQGTPLPSGLTAVSVQAQLLNTTLSSSTCEEYHLFVSMYFQLSQNVTLYCPNDGKLETSNYLDTQVRLDNVNGTDLPQLASPTYCGARVGAWGWSNNVLSLLPGQVGELTADATTQCQQAELAWGISGIPCTLTGIEIGSEGYGFSSLDSNWFGLSYTTASNYQLAPAAAVTGKSFDHIVIIAMENQYYSRILGTGTGNVTCCPFLASMLPLSSTIPKFYSYGANLFPGDTISGCSAACYTAETSGNTSGSKNGLASGSINTPNIFDSLAGAGLTWKGFCEDNCPRHADHFPPLQYADTYTSTCPPSLSENCYVYTCPSCPAGNVSDSQLVSELNSASPANYIWFTPTDSHNMHNNLPSSGDAYLQQILVGNGTVSNPAAGSVLSTDAFTSGRTLLYIWWDEYNPSPNLLYQLGVVNQGFVSGSKSYDEYASLLTIENNWGLTCLQLDCRALVMSDVFDSPPDFTTSASPASVTMQAGQQATSTIAITSLNGFSGTVSLNATGATGLNLSLSQTSLTLSPGASGNLTLTITALSTVGPGSYAVQVNGASGSLEHSATVTIQVAVSSPPLLSVPGFENARAGSTLVFVVNSTDPDGDTVSMLAAGLPSGASFDQSTGKFSWTPSSNDVGIYTVTFTATDNAPAPLSTAKSAIIMVRLASTQPIAPLPQGICFRCILTAYGPIALVTIAGLVYLRARPEILRRIKTRRRKS